jgi:hypothetical protein
MWRDGATRYQRLNTEKLSTTLKTMSKKQLRQVKKTRVNATTGVVEFVPATRNRVCVLPVVECWYAKIETEYRYGDSPKEILDDASL